MRLLRLTLFRFRQYSAGQGGQCFPDSGCRSTGGSLQNNRDGTSTCVCPSPKVTSPQNTCVLPASARARAARIKARSQLTLDYPSVEGDDHLKCPDGERACSLGSGNGYECLDVTSTLDSCASHLVSRLLVHALTSAPLG